MITGMKEMIRWRTPRKSTRGDYDVKLKVSESADDHKAPRVTFTFGKSAQIRLSKQYSMMRFSDVSNGETVLWFEFIEGNDDGYYTVSRHSGQVKVQATIDDIEKESFIKNWGKGAYTLYHEDGDLFYITAEETKR